MPKVRPRVCQKSAFLGPVRFQDAIWKCFKCQKKCDTLSSVFISFSPVCLFPWHLYGLRVSSLRLSVQHTDLGEALLCTKQLCLLTIYFCFFFLDSLTFVSIMLLWPTPKLLNTFFLSGCDTELSLSSVPAIHMDLLYSFWARTVATWPELGTPRLGFSLSLCRSSINEATCVQ